MTVLVAMSRQYEMGISGYEIGIIVVSWLKIIEVQSIINVCFIQVYIFVFKFLQGAVRHQT